jgi:hypothetical protein
MHVGQHVLLGGASISVASLGTLGRRWSATVRNWAWAAAASSWAQAAPIQAETMRRCAVPPWRR